MNEQLLKDFIATAQKYNYNWNKAFGLFPELKGYDQQLLKDYVATAEKNNYDYKKVNSLFPEFGFNQEPVKKKESTVSASKLEKPTSGSSSRRFEGVTEEPISQKKVRTEDYLDQVQNIQKKPKATTQKVESTFEQPKETKPSVEFDTLSDKEAMQMMAEDFGKKEFEAYSSINEIPSSKKLRDLDEETTANILNKQFEGTNLEFKKLGWQLTVTSKIGDGINSTILNQETIDLSDPNADKELKSFVSTNLVKKSEREQFENAQSVEDLVELVGSNPNKFKASLLEGMDVDSYFERERQLLNGEMTRAKADTYDSDLKSYEQKVAKFNQDVKGGKMSKADFDARSSELENERNSLTQRRDIMSSVIRKAEKIDKLTNNLEKANVITAAEREKQGSLTGLVLRGVGEGLTDVSQALIDFGISGAAAVTDAKTLADAITPGEYERLKELGFSDDEIKNEIQKSVKNKANQVLRSVPDAFGMGTTEEYAKSTDRGVIEQAAFAIGESLGAVGGGLATAGTNAGFFAMSYNALEDQMRGPQFDALSENEKKIMSVPYGLVIGALEKLGAKVATGAAKNKTLGMFSEYIMSKTFSSLPKNASLLEIKSAIDKSVAASVANGMLKITGAGIVEGGTEFTQQIFEGVEKDIANRIIQSNQLDKAKEEGGGTVSKEIYNQIVQNKFFKDAADLSTTEGIGQLLKESGNAFLVGAVAGGMGSTASVGVVEPISNKVSNNRFAVYRDIILNDDAREGAISSINKKVEDNQITREQADEEIKSINEAYPALRQIPTNFSVGAQREAFGLLMERESLDKEIKDKDPNLVAKQKDRVAEINEQLKGLSYAVQEQGADAVPVQSGAGVGTEVEERVPESETQRTTGKTVREKTQVEQAKTELSEEERQSVIDSFVETERESINNLGDTVTQEEKQGLSAELEANPIAYAEARKNDGGTYTEFLNQLTPTQEEQQAPAAEVVQPSEKLTVNPLEGYSFEYESENDVPAELKGVEPTGKSETKVGRGKNAKTKLKLTFTGQQLIDAGLATTQEAAEVVQPTVQAAPTAKIETIEVQEVPQVEQTLDDLTQQNNVLTQNDFTAAKIRNVGKEKVVAQITRAAKAIAKVLPKVKIVVHATPEAFVEATKDMDGRLSEGGLYDRKTGQIHINLEKATNRTVPHEVFHALILSRVNTDVEAQRLTRSMINSVRKSLKKAEGTAELMSYLEEFESNYDENIKNEEKLSELFAILADNYKQLPPASKNIIVRFLNRLAKAIGLKEMTDREAIQFMNTLSRKVETGQEIEAREVGQQKEGDAAVRKQKGLINLTDQEAIKYARAGVENKYDAQAIKQIGLQGTNFDKKSILERIQKEFDGLVKNTTDYIFREDSPAIDQAIQNEIDTMVNQGYSNDQIERAKRALKPGSERDNVINEYRRAQVETANQWERYLGQSDYTPAFKYLILDAVLTNNYDLKSDRYQKRTAKTIRNFTPFDAGTLATLYVSDSNELLKDYVKIQADNSANIVESAEFSSTKDGKWIKFDGGKNLGNQELQDNANKLSQLVQNTYWCTKTNALAQLSYGDFYVYVTENQQGDFDPRIAVRMKGDEVAEVRGNASSKQDLEADMLPVADKFLKEKIPNDSGKKWLDSIAYNTKVKDLTDKIDNKVLNMDDVMNYIDILKDKDKFSVDYGENGLVQTLQDKFKDAKFSFGVANSKADIKDDTLLLIKQNPFSSWDIDRNEQIKNVQVIIGNVIAYDNFDGGKVKTISGSVEFNTDSSVKEIKSIESIGGNLILKESNIRNLGSLKEIGGRAEFRDSKVSDLGNLKRIGEVADFRRANLYSLGNLEFVGRSLRLRDSRVDDLGNLKEVGGDANFQDSRVTTLGNLKKVGGTIDLEFSEVEDLGDLEFVGGDFLAEGKSTKLKTLGNLKKVGGSLNIAFESSIEDLGNLTEVGKNFFVSSNKNLKSLGKLELIGGNVDFQNTKIENLGKLKKIGGNAYFVNSNVKDLGDLESIGSAVWFNNKIKDLGKLKPVARGKASFDGNEQLEKQYRERQQSQFAEYKERQKSQFAVRKQKTTSPDKIVDDGIKAGKTDADIRQEGKAAGFTNKEMTEALSKYYTKEQKVFMKSGVKGLVGRFVDGAKRFKQKFLTSKGLLPKIGFTYKEKMEGEISAEANRAAKTAKKFGVLFDKFTGDKELLLKAFDKALRGDKSIQLPAGFAALANEMRNHIDRLSEMLITTGAVEGDMADAIRENMGSYITRSYEIFDNKNFRQKVGEQELQAAKNFLRTEPGMISLAKAEAARTGTTINEALDILVDNKIDEYFADAETGALVKGAKLGSKDLSTLKERKEIPEQIRMLMGEYSDPAMNYARTVLNISSLVARHQFLTQVKEAGMGKFFFEKNDSQRPKGFDTEIASEGSDTMSPLNGLMTTPEIAEAFDLYNGKQGEDHWAQQAIKVYYKAMGLVKWLKTIGSVATHAKNIFSNLGFVAVNGHSLIEIGKAVKVVAQDLKTMSKPEVEAKIDEYIKAGIMRQGAGINEIRDMFKDADMDGFLERRLSMKKRKGVMGKIRQAISSRSSKIISAMEDAYQAEDDMFKIAAYETEMNRYADALYNKSKDQLTDKEKQEVSDIAANNVKNTYPTYSRIPEGIKRLRRFPLFIGSFISFQAESYRTAYNTIALAKDELSSKNKKIKKIGARRVAGASSYLAAKTAMLSYLGYAAGTGIGGALGALFDDDDEKKKEKDVRSFLPPWSQNSDLIILKAADGQIEYIDFSASDPHGGINKALNAFLKGDDLLDSFKQSTLELVGQFQGPDILTNLAIQLKGNENDFGKPIYNEEDSFSQKADKILDYVYKVVEPGTITSIRKAAASEQSLSQIAFGDATGLKVRKSDVKEQFGYKLAEFDESFKDIRKIYNSEYYKSLDIEEDPNATKKDIQEQNKKTEESLIRANEKYAAKAKELMDLINSANRLGVDYDELINELGFIKSTMGKSNISEMENGGDEFIKEKEN